MNVYGPAHDPNLGVLIANVNNLGQPMRIVWNADGSYSNAGPLAGLRRLWGAERQLPAAPPPWASGSASP